MHPEHELISTLSEELDRTLRRVLPPPGPCALLDFPNHQNVGDSLIWLGEVRFLRRHGYALRYTCDLATFDASRLERCLPKGPILLHGGGNLGDLWPEHHAFRERLLERFPDRKIVQLPQSVSFSSEAALERTRAVFAAHPDLTVLLRDRHSVEAARTGLAIDPVLCPDMVFAIGQVPERPAPRSEILWLARGDHESTISGESVPSEALVGVERVDWAGKERDPLSRVRKKLTKWVKRERPGSDALSRLLRATYDRSAEQRLQLGSELLGRGQVVVSDRLHAHLLCLLLGIPHVMLDNCSGKISAFHETWTAPSRITRFATDLGDAFEYARRMTTEGPAPSGAPLQEAS